MLCPLPCTCIHDDFEKTGVHFCAAVRCHHMDLLKKQLNKRITAISGLEEQSPANLLELDRLQRELAGLSESG